MNVGIVAASLIVMHPCLKAIHDAVVTRCHFQTMFPAGEMAQSTPTRGSGLMHGKSIVRNIDFELESQPVSTQEITPKDLL